MRLIDADAFDKCLEDAQAECKKNGGNFRFGVLNTVRGNLRKQPTFTPESVTEKERRIDILEHLPDAFDRITTGDCSHSELTSLKEYVGSIANSLYVIATVMAGEDVGVTEEIKETEE